MDLAGGGFKDGRFGGWALMRTDEVLGFVWEDRI
jgi:hypothetical protein